MPHILVRFMAIRDPQEVKKSRNIAMIWVLISLSVAVCIGFTGAALYPNVAELAGNGNQRIFIYMTTHLFKELIPLFMAGVILSGILAATMSTSDSQLFASSNSFTITSLGSSVYKLTTMIRIEDTINAGNRQ